MKRKQQNFLVGIMSISFATVSYAQESVVASGGNASGTGGTSSYSVGQIAYASIAGSNGYVLQGNQQPYEIITLGKDEFTGIDLVMTAYPNPTIDILNLVVTTNQWDDLSCNLFDSSGKTVSKNLKITSPETSVSMQGLNQGIYFLTLSNNGKTIKTFKIIKK